MIVVPDTVISDVLSFLDEADAAGKGVMAVINQAAALSATANPVTGEGGEADGGMGGAATAAVGGAGTSLGATGGGGGAAGATGTWLLPGSAGRTVSQEARLLKTMFMHLQDEH